MCAQEIRNRMFRLLKPSYFQCDDLHHEASTIRNTLLQISKEKFSHRSTLVSFFGMTPIQNHLHNFKKYLSKDQQTYFESLEKTCHQLILKEHLPLLQQFYHAKKQENSLLGRLYSQISFNEMLCRLVQNRYQTIYLDGRLVVYRPDDSEQVESALKSLSGRVKILTVGAMDDRHDLYKKYLTIEESAVSHLVFANGYFLATNRGLRKEEGFLTNYWFQNTIMNELKSAHVGPILITYVVGPELRDGRTLHYDGLFCLQRASEIPGDFDFERRQKIMRDQGFSSVCKSIYGDEYPHGPKPKEQCEILEFKHGDDEKKYFYVNAYKNRLKLSLKQALVAHELFMPYPGTIRLKGFGLGAFGISSLNFFLEKLYIETLYEVLQTFHPKKVSKIELLNFPSTMSRYEVQAGDTEYYMQYGGGLQTKNLDYFKDVNIECVHLLAPSLEKSGDVYFSTQVCGDSMSLVGNEATIGYPPSSSDEAAMYYALGGLSAIANHATLETKELTEKILMTDGVHAYQLDGCSINMDLSAVKCTHLPENTVLKTRPLSIQEAMGVMNHANRTKGAVASINQENDGWECTITVTSECNLHELFAEKS